MAGRRKPLAEPAAKTGECQCGQIAAPRLYEARGRCLFMCGATIPEKYVFCRPCAKGNHTGEPCAKYRGHTLKQFDFSCEDCGFDSARHAA